MCSHHDALDIIGNLQVSAQPIYPFSIKLRHENNLQDWKECDILWSCWGGRYTIIYDFYFDDDYDVNYDINYDNNGESNDIIDDFLINKLEFICKEIMGGVQEKKNWFSRCWFVF